MFVKRLSELRALKRSTRAQWRVTTRDLLLPEARLENLSDEFLERVSALISSKMVWLGGWRPNNGHTGAMIPASNLLTE